MYKKILLKLSGEALSTKDSPYSVFFLDYVAKQIKSIVAKGVKVGIVVGGGNICRGRTFQELGIDRRKSDYIGMGATVLNAQMLACALDKNKVQNVVFTKYPIANVKDYTVKGAKNCLRKGYVCIFGGGTGKPFYSTDTACAQRATDIGAEVILFAKSGVDGVYDSDPKTNPKAHRYDELSFNDIIKKKLKVIDIEAAKICKENKIKGFVFDMSSKDAIKKSVTGKITGTIIK